MQCMLRQPASGMCAAAVHKPRVCTSHGACKDNRTPQAWLRHVVHPHSRLRAASGRTAPPPNINSAADVNGGSQQQQQQQQQQQPHQSLQQQVTSLTSLLLASQQSTLHLAQQVQQLNTQLGALQDQHLQQQQTLQAQQLQWQQAQAQELEQVRAALQQQQECVNQELGRMQQMLATMQGMLVEQTVASAAATPTAVPTVQQQLPLPHLWEQQQQQQDAEEQMKPDAGVGCTAAQQASSILHPPAAGWSDVTVPSLEELHPSSTLAAASSTGVKVTPGSPGAAEDAAAVQESAAAATAADTALVSPPPHTPAPAPPLDAAAGVENITPAAPAVDDRAAATPAAAAAAPAVDDVASTPPPAPSMDARVALQQLLAAHPQAVSSDGLDTATAQQVQVAVQALAAAAADAHSWSPQECAQVLLVAACSLVSFDQGCLERVSPEWLEQLAAAAAADPATASCQEGGPGVFWAAVKLKCHAGLGQPWLQALATDTQRPASWQGWYIQARPDEAVVGYVLAALSHPLLGPAARQSLQLLKGVEAVVQRRGGEVRTLLALLLVLQQQGYHFAQAALSSRAGKGSSGGKSSQQKAAVDVQGVQLQQLQQQLADMAVAGLVQGAQHGAVTAADAAEGVNLLAQLGWYQPPSAANHQPAAAAAAAGGGDGMEGGGAHTTPQQVLLDAAAAGFQGSDPCSLDTDQMLGVLSAATAYGGPQVTYRLLQQMAPSLQQQLDSLDVARLVQLLTSTAGLVTEVTLGSATGPSSVDTASSKASEGPVMELLESMFIRLNNQWARLSAVQLVDVTTQLSSLPVPALRGCNVEAYAAAALAALNGMSQPITGEGGSSTAGKQQQRRTKQKGGGGAPSGSSSQGRKQQQQQAAGAEVSPAPLLACYQQLCRWEAAGEDASTPRSKTSGTAAAAAAGGGGGGGAKALPEELSEEQQHVGRALCLAAEAAAVAQPQVILLTEWTILGTCFMKSLHLTPSPQFMAAWCKAFQEAVASARSSSSSPKQPGKAAAAAPTAAPAASGPSPDDALTLLQLLHASRHAEDLMVMLPADRAQPAEPFQAPAAVLKALQAALAAAVDDLSPHLQLSSLLAFADLQQGWQNPAAAVDAASVGVLLEGAGPALSRATSQQLVQLACGLAVWWKPDWAASDWVKEWASGLSTQVASISPQQHQQLLLYLDQMSTSKGEPLPEELLEVAGEVAQAACSPGQPAEGVLVSAMHMAGIFFPARRAPPEAVRAAMQPLITPVLLDEATDFDVAVKVLISTGMLALQLHPSVLLSFLEQHGTALVQAVPVLQVQVLSLYATAGAPSHPVLRQAADACWACLEGNQLSMQHVLMLGQAIADLQLMPAAKVQQFANGLQEYVKQATKKASKPVKAPSKGTPEAVNRQRQKQADTNQLQLEAAEKLAQVWGRAAETLAAAEVAGEVVWPPPPQSHVQPWEKYITGAGPPPLQQPAAAPRFDRAVTSVDALEALQQEVLTSMEVPLLDQDMVQQLLEQAAAFDMGLVEGSGAGLEEEGEVIDV